MRNIILIVVAIIILLVVLFAWGVFETGDAVLDSTTDTEIEETEPLDDPEPLEETEPIQD